MDILAVTLFVFVYLIAIAGLFVPVLPDVPLAAAGALLAGWLTGFERLGLTPLLVVAGLTLLAILTDYVAGFIGARRFGAARAGVLGSIAGSLVGLFFFPPLGFLIGALLGAVGGELLSGRVPREALRAGIGVFVGTLGGILANLFILIAVGMVVFPRLF